MRAALRNVAIVEVLLVIPAVLFMAALFLRGVQPLLGTGRLVMWFAHHPPVGLDVCLVAMPLAALLLGGGIVVRSWRRDEDFREGTEQILAIARARWAPLLIAVATLTAGAILALVAMHLVTE